MTSRFAAPPPTVEQVKDLCRRARAAGAPKGAARPRLVGDYQRLAAALGVDASPVATGADLVRETASLLRAADPARRTR